MSTNKKLPTYEEAQSVTTEFAWVVEKYLNEKGLGKNYTICVIQTVRNQWSEDTEGEEGTMSTTTHLWDGPETPIDDVFIRTAIQLQKLSRKLFMKWIQLTDILRKVADSIEWKECDCPGCKAEKEKKESASAE